MSMPQSVACVSDNGPPRSCVALLYRESSISGAMQGHKRSEPAPAPVMAVFLGYGSHLFADMMTLGGNQPFWPSKLIVVFPGLDEYRVVSGSGSETVFVAVALALLFYPVSRVGFDGLLYRLGGADQVYGRVTKVTDGDTISAEVYGQVQPVRLIGVDTPETVAPDQPVGCHDKEASAYTRRTLGDRLVRLEIPRIGDSEDAYGRTLADVYLLTGFVKCF